MFVRRVLQGNSPTSAGRLSVLGVRLGHFPTQQAQFVVNVKSSHKACFQQIYPSIAPAAIKKYPGIMIPTNPANGSVWKAITGMLIPVFSVETPRLHVLSLNIYHCAHGRKIQNARLVTISHQILCTQSKVT